MMGMMLVVPVEGEIIAVPLNKSPDLETLQDGVGGMIEAVPYFQEIQLGPTLHNCVAFCNEEGKLNGLGINYQATNLWEQSLQRKRMSLYVDGYPKPSDVLVGPIIVIYGDHELMDSL